jgi:4-methyl-5(b-hydroxyethyl)-thiazole monophosphate biosynthesis
MITVLIILADGFEEIEAFTPIDLLRRAGAQVTVASLGDDMHVTGRTGITAHTDTTLASVATAVFDCLVLPGGPGTKLLRADPRVRSAVLRHHSGGHCVAAICAAPAVLHDAGLLAGRRYTAHPSVAAELPGILSGNRVVVDGNIVTSRGAGTALDFGLALIEKLFSSERSREVSRHVCA